MQNAIRQEGLDGWLFCNFHHRDPLADKILCVNAGAVNTRFWFYALPASGEALAILHDIERDILDPGLPGRREFYRTQDALLARLAPLSGKRWGCHFSSSIAAISFLDAGTAAMLDEAGLRLVSAAGLLQRFMGLLDEAGMASHERAAGHLYEIVALAWNRVRLAFAAHKPVTEGDIQQLMLREFTQRNLVCDHPPIVAAGANSGLAHYSVTGTGAAFTPNDVIQFDLWAKETRPGGVYADISWVGVFADHVPDEMSRAFSILRAAREGALGFIQDELKVFRRPSGAEVDRRVRAILENAGVADAIRHRTGHGIDREVHGSGVNIDSLEFPDERLLLDGACFSLEPGIYFERFGMRTEIDVYIKDGTAIVSGGERQSMLLHC